jgi:3-methyl-2-oxobutanoate hydroxymethyltransferase
MAKPSPRITTAEIQALKDKGEKITVLTAYDAIFATLEDEAGIEVILVGDSAGMVVAGHDSTLPVTMEQMLYHTRCVTRSVKRALVIADMPFMSFQISPEQALKNAGRFLQEGRANGVKLEGGAEMAETVSRMVEVGIPVVGHIGLIPQSINKFGGYFTQGADAITADRLLRDAKALESAGAFMIVLEKVASETARKITDSLKVPTIGIGSGPHCDGQVLVVYDMLGLFSQFKPKFVRRYLDLAGEVSKAFKLYREDIKTGKFPSQEESF